METVTNKKANRASAQDGYSSHCIPCLGQACAKLRMTLLRAERGREPYPVQRHILV